MKTIKQVFVIAIGVCIGEVLFLLVKVAMLSVGGLWAFYLFR